MDNGQFLLFFEKEFGGIRLIDDYFIPTKWKIKCDISPVDDTVESVDINILISKLNFWVSNVLDDSILVSGLEEYTFDLMAIGASNNIVLCPDEPADDVLAILLQAKFNAFAKEKFDVSYLEIKSEPSNGVNFVLVDHSEHRLPSMSDWMGDYTWFTQPWWHRDDLSTIDDIPPDGANLNVPPPYAESFKFIEDAFAEDVEPEEKPSATIIKHEFRPHVINGGLSEDKSPKKRGRKPKKDKKDKE